MEATKQCSKCGEIKALTEFCKSKHSKDDRTSTCKMCRNTVARRHRAVNPEKAREYERKNRAKKPEKALEYGRNYRAANPEKVREYSRNYYAAKDEEDLEEKRRRHAEMMGGIKSVHTMQLIHGRCLTLTSVLY
jgi:hypothetical protein